MAVPRDIRQRIEKGDLEAVESAWLERATEAPQDLDWFTGIGRHLAASGHPETILALACFLGERGHSPIGVADVEACYSLLGITPSANFNADFNSLVRRRLLIEAPRGHAGRKAWILTDGGLAAIHEKLRTS